MDNKEQQARTHAERQAAYKRRQGDRGLVLVSTWVPADRAQEVRDLAARIREETSK